MRKIVIASTLALAAAIVVPAGIATAADAPPVAPAPAPAPPAPVPATIAPADRIAFEKSLHKQTGDITIPAANATLHLGDKYYYLAPDEAKRVLVDLWGNPPSAVSDTLGLVLPAGSTVLDNAWGAVITWDDRGYVTDDDADSADYAKVLSDMQAGQDQDNAQRTAAGYKAMHLIGWAQPPSYDKANHSLIWARDIRLDGDPVDGLNYDVRVLGRKGVLSMNMLWDMPHLAAVRTAAQDFGKVASFGSGATYADYDSSTDKAAGYGLAGLVAGGVAIAVAKKAGLLALLVPFFKWIAIGLAAVVAGGRKFFARMLGRRERDELEG